MNDFFAARRGKLRKLLQKQNADALLVTNVKNVTWLTGFTGDDSYLLIHPEGECLLSDFRYEIQIAEECPGLRFAIRSGACGFSQLILDELKKISSSPWLGVETNSVTLGDLERFQNSITKQIVPLDSLIESLRQVKDRQEIALIRQSAQIARNAFHAVRAMLRPDWTEKQIADELEFAMRRLGARDASFPTIVAVGDRAALCHCVPGERKVRDAAFLLIDWGAKYEGYASDLTRVLVTGKISSEFKKIYGIVKDAQQKAIDAIQPGIPCSEIDAVARCFIADAGYGKFFDHGLGHGIGLDIHEAPAFSPRCGTKLKPGMIITVEPGIYVKGWGGVRIEDDVLVTRSGCEVITDVEKELDDMIVD